jgi:uncharacterized protein YjbJ (UPF0337 family)
MGSAGDKAKGMANQVAGSVKEGVGRATGSSDLEAEGMAQKGKGKVQEAVGKTKDAVKSGANKVADMANRKL